MNLTKVVVTYYVSENERYLYKEALADKANLVFIKDRNKEERAAELEKADVMLTWNVSKELDGIERNIFKQLRFVQLLSAGYDHLSFNILPDECLVAANQGAYSEPMAEHVVAMILALSKRLLINHKKMAQGEFDQATPNRSLKNSTVGIIGFGGIGIAVTHLLKNFGVKILAINTSGRTNQDVEFIGTLNDLDYVLNRSDIVILSIPLNNSTLGLIGKRELSLMKPTAMLINVARGGLIVEKDLFDHLKSNPDFLAGIDAWWIEPFMKGEFRLNFPVLDLPNVIGSPHNSAVVPDSLIAGQKRALDNVLNYLNNKTLSGVVKRD
jgi:phosphoglycerate dehydrogenase-like enzyme